MTRFANEHAYDAIIDAEVSTAPGIDRALVQAMIATESGFKPSAYREEPSINDASRGLMQILLKTARGVGFTGAADQLYDPAINIRYGVKHLAGLVKAKSDVWAAVSAYNNGNGKRATSTVTVCDARDAAGRCVRSHVAKAGEFFNQPYVDKVKGFYSYFSGGVAQAGAGGALAVLLLFALVMGRFVRA